MYRNSLGKGISQKFEFANLRDFSSHVHHSGGAGGHHKALWKLSTAFSQRTEKIWEDFAKFSFLSNSARKWKFVRENTHGCSEWTSAVPTMQCMFRTFLDLQMQWRQCLACRTTWLDTYQKISKEKDGGEALSKFGSAPGMHFGRGWSNIAQHWEGCEKSLLEIGNAQMQRKLAQTWLADFEVKPRNIANWICLRFVIGNEKAIASAGNRTRINCLEGSYANHYTTDAFYSSFSCQYKQVFSVYSNQIGDEKTIASAGNRTRINCLGSSYANHYTTDASIVSILSGWKSDFDLLTTSVQ